MCVAPSAAIGSTNPSACSGAAESGWSITPMMIGARPRTTNATAIDIARLVQNTVSASSGVSFLARGIFCTMPWMAMTRLDLGERHRNGEDADLARRQQARQDHEHDEREHLVRGDADHGPQDRPAGLLSQVFVVEARLVGFRLGQLARAGFGLFQGLPACPRIVVHGLDIGLYRPANGARHTALPRPWPTRRAPLGRQVLTDRSGAGKWPRPGKQAGSAPQVAALHRCHRDATGAASPRAIARAERALKSPPPKWGRPWSAHADIRRQGGGSRVSVEDNHRSLPHPMLGAGERSRSNSRLCDRRHTLPATALSAGTRHPTSMI